MGKSNVAEKTYNGAAEVAEVKTVEAVAAPVMTIVKNETEEPRKLSLDEKIQRVEDLTLLIDRWRTLNESRRKLQTFQIGADSLSSVILLRDAAGNEFKTSNSSVITSVIDEMKLRWMLKSVRLKNKSTFENWERCSLFLVVAERLSNAYSIYAFKEGHF